MKFNKHLIKDTLHFIEYEDLDRQKKYAAASNLEVLDYMSLKSAYNPLYPDAGKIVRIPENYLYSNDRHHLKDFVIVDGKEDRNGNQVIIGFLGTSQVNKKSKKLTTKNPEELIAISKVVIDKNRYHKLIKKSKSSFSQKELSDIQLMEIKGQSKTPANINKSKNFRR